MSNSVYSSRASISSSRIALKLQLVIGGVLLNVPIMIIGTGSTDSGNAVVTSAGTYVIQHAPDGQGKRRGRNRAQPARVSSRAKRPARHHQVSII